MDVEDDEFAAAVFVQVGDPAGDRTSLVTSGRFTTDEWHHIAWTADESSYGILVDGEDQTLVKRNPSGASGDNDGGFFDIVAAGDSPILSIGARKFQGTVGSYLDGHVDELSIYSVVLTAYFPHFPEAIFGVSARCDFGFHHRCKRSYKAICHCPFASLYSRPRESLLSPRP